MAVLKVIPTRMQLNQLQEKKLIAQRGYDLLKEKQDALIRSFMQHSEQARVLRRQVESSFAQIYQAYRQASLITDQRLLSRSFFQAPKPVEVEITRDYILNLRIPKFNYQQTPPTTNTISLLALPSVLDGVAKQTPELITMLVELAQHEKACLLLANEIKQTRRRVNALKYKTIIDLEDTIKYIKLRIDDNEREQKSRFITMKR